MSQFLNLLAHVIGVPGERDGLEHCFQPLAFGFLHFLQFFRVGKVWRGMAGDFLGLLKPSSSRRARFSSECRMA